MGQGRIVISNSTPLINFAIIRRIDILQQLFGKLCVPPAVEHELLRKGKHYPSVTELDTYWSTLIEVIEVRNVTLCRLLKLSVDDGEAEAIALALEQNTRRLILDESRGRALANSYHIPLTGSIGCLVQAKHKGIIPAIKPLLDAMQAEARFWIHERLYQKILAENNE